MLAKILASSVRRRIAPVLMVHMFAVSVKKENVWCVDLLVVVVRVLWLKSAIAVKRESLPTAVAFA